MEKYLVMWYGIVYGKIWEVSYDGKVREKMVRRRSYGRDGKSYGKKMMIPDGKGWGLLNGWVVLLLISAKVIRPSSVCGLNWAEAGSPMKNRSSRHGYSGLSCLVIYWFCGTSFFYLVDLSGWRGACKHDGCWWNLENLQKCLFEWCSCLGRLVEQ